MVNSSTPDKVLYEAVAESHPLSSREGALRSSWLDAFSRSGAHVFLGVMVGLVGLGIAAAGIPVGKEAMAIGFTWAARSMWGSKDS